jgi:hypothetical protein
MGADLLLTTLVWDKDRKLNWKAGHTAIDALQTYDDENHEPSENGHLECDTPELTKEELHDLLDNVKQATEDNFRDASIMFIGHLNILYSGGMSWGDSPSEIYDAINTVSEFSSVTEAVGLDTPEDLINYKGVVDKLMKNKATLPLLLGLDKDLDKILEQKLKGVRK